MLLLENKVALVTGASRGIGKAISRKYADEGAVVYAGIRNEQVASEIEYYNEATNGKVIPVLLDVCDKNSIKECIMTIKKQAGIIDILVNNAGIMILGRLEMVSDVSIKEIYDTNVFGLLHVTQMAMRLLKKSEAPTIVNMSSLMARDSDVGYSVYASSKAAVESMTKTWAKEYAPMGFRINAIAPGNVGTDMLNVVDKEELEKAFVKIGMGRVAAPEEIANVALFLASDLASYVTGEVINVNGGLSV